MKKSFWIAVIAALVLPLGAVAEHHEAAEEQPPLTDVWLMVPKRGMEADFTAAVAKHMAFRVKAGESQSWLAFRPVLGKNLSVVQYRSCCFDYADLDTNMAESAKLGLDEDWNKNVDPYVDHYHHYFDVNDWENSHWPEGSNGPYYGVTTWKLKENIGPGPREARKKFSQMAKKEGWAEGHNWLWLNSIGGEPRLAIVTSMENLAELAPEENTFFDFVAEKMGSAEDAMKMFEQFGSGFASSDFTVWMYDAAISTPSTE
jgi:hypothetical protein